MGSDTNNGRHYPCRALSPGIPQGPGGWERDQRGTGGGGAGAGDWAAALTRDSAGAGAGGWERDQRGTGGLEPGPGMGPPHSPGIPQEPGRDQGNGPGTT